MHLISFVWLRLCGADFALAHQVDSHVASGLGFCEYVVGLIFSVFPWVFGSGHSCYICLHWGVCGNSSHYRWWPSAFFCMEWVRLSFTPREVMVWRLAWLQSVGRCPTSSLLWRVAARSLFHCHLRRRTSTTCEEGGRSTDWQKFSNSEWYSIW